MEKLKIEVKNLNKSFDEVQILHDVNLEVKESSAHVIIGGSGSGKSVLIKSIIGLLDADEGSSIKVDGEEIFPFNEEKRNNLMARCGFLFQHGALFDSLPVWSNICFRLIRQNKMPKDEAMFLAEKKLLQVGLKNDILNKFPSELSGGMQKRVSLARSIAHDPEIVFFDEPTTGLDPIMSSVINELIKKTSHELNATTVTITHDMRTVNTIADDVSMLINGKITWQGSKDEMQHSSNEFLNSFIKGES